MSQLPPLELLEATHQFPCYYTFKTVGSPADEFKLAVEKVFKSSTSFRIQVRETSQNKHASVTVDVWVQTASEVHFWYEQAMKVEGLVLIF